MTGYELQLGHLAVLGISWCAFVYGYGYRTNKYAFSKDYIESSLYHGSMHILASGLWSYAIYVRYLQEQAGFHENNLLGDLKSE
jgi:hypothetical protein